MQYTWLFSTPVLPPQLYLFLEITLNEDGRFIRVFDLPAQQAKRTLFIWSTISQASGVMARLLHAVTPRHLLSTLAVNRGDCSSTYIASFSLQCSIFFPIFQMAARVRWVSILSSIQRGGESHAPTRAIFPNSGLTNCLLSHGRKARVTDRKYCRKTLCYVETVGKSGNSEKRRRIFVMFFFVKNAFQTKNP